MRDVKIGLRILQRRKQLGLTQTELAERMGYKSKSTINKIEKCINDVSQSHIVKFAEALQTTEAFLMGWIDDPDKKIKSTIPFDFDVEKFLQTIPSSKNMLFRAINDDIETDDTVVSPSDLDKALELYKLYKNAIPQIQQAVENLLKPSQSDS